jgi:hypothetical protein
VNEEAEAEAGEKCVSQKLVTIVTLTYFSWKIVLFNFVGLNTISSGDVCISIICVCVVCESVEKSCQATSFAADFHFEKEDCERHTSNDCVQSLLNA